MEPGSHWVFRVLVGVIDLLVIFRILVGVIDLLVIDLLVVCAQRNVPRACKHRPAAAILRISAASTPCPARRPRPPAARRGMAVQEPDNFVRMARRRRKDQNAPLRRQPARSP